MAEQDVKVIDSGVDDKDKGIEPEVSTYDGKKSSGLGRMIDRMNSRQEVIIKDPQKPAEPIKPEEPSGKTSKFDYSLFKDVSEGDIKGYKDQMKDLPEEAQYKYINAMNDVKKNQRLVSERQLEIDNLKKTGGTNEEYDKFLTELRKDFVGTYDKYKEKFNLPDVNYVKQQLTGGGFQSRLAQWQETELTSTIEKKHKLEEGTFIYEHEDAYKAGTPSYDYRILTVEKEKEFLEEEGNIKKRTSDAMGNIEKARKEQMVELRQTYFPDLEGDSEEVKTHNKKNDEMFVSMLQKIDEMGKSLKEGKFDGESNPFALKNIFRGVHFEPLAKQLVDAAVRKVHAEYQKLGYYLPANGKDMPSDLTKIQGKHDAVITNEQLLKRSPMARMVNRTIK